MENLTGGTPPVRYLPCVVPCKLYFGDYETTGKMKEMDEKLSGMNFCRGNKGYLINLQHVDRIQDNCAVVKGEELVLSRARKKEFMEALTRYWGEVIK